MTFYYHFRLRRRQNGEASRRNFHQSNSKLFVPPTPSITLHRRKVCSSYEPYSSGICTTSSRPRDTWHAGNIKKRLPCREKAVHFQPSGIQKTVNSKTATETLFREIYPLENPRYLVWQSTANRKLIGNT